MEKDEKSGGKEWKRVEVRVVGKWRRTEEPKGEVKRVDMKKREEWEEEDELVCLENVA